MFPAGLPITSHDRRQRPQCRGNVRHHWPGIPDESVDTDMIKRHPLVIFTLLDLRPDLARLDTTRCRRTRSACWDNCGRGFQRSPLCSRLHLTGGREAVVDLLRRLVRWRVAWWWYLLVILGPAAFSAVVAGVYVLAGGSWQEAAPEAFGSSTPTLALFFVVFMMTDGVR